MAEVQLLQVVGALLVLVALVTGFFIVREVVLALRQLVDRRVPGQEDNPPVAADSPAAGHRNAPGEGERAWADRPAASGEVPEARREEDSLQTEG